MLKVEIQLKKLKPSLWKRIGLPCHGSGEENNSDSQITYSKMKVVDTINVNYNTKILVLSHLDQSFCTTPVGHHLRVRMTLEGIYHGSVCTYFMKNQRPSKVNCSITPFFRSRGCTLLYTYL